MEFNLSVSFMHLSNNNTTSVQLTIIVFFFIRLGTPLLNLLSVKACYRGRSHELREDIILMVGSWTKQSSYWTIPLYIAEDLSMAYSGSCLIIVYQLELGVSNTARELESH